MSRRATGRASAARGAPFGTDIQPKFNVKIIGGVTVEVPLNQPPPKSSLHRGSIPSLREGPHGTPPIQTQPINSEYISELQPSRVAIVTTHYGGNITAAAPVHPTTSPSESSNSHIHDGVGRRHSSFPNSNRILPPISPRPSVSQPVGEHWQLSVKSPTQSPVMLPPRITLSDQLRPHLSGYDPYHFKEMYSDLAEVDRKLTGYVNNGQISLMSLKHKLPVPTPLMKLLVSSFVHETDGDLVNYEKLISYLARVQLGTANAETLLDEAVKRFVNASSDTNGNDQHLEEQLVKSSVKITSQHSHRDQSEDRILTADQDPSRKTRGTEEFTRRKPLRTFSVQENAKFLSLLKQQYTLDDNDSHDFSAMKEKFEELTGNPEVATGKQVDQVCLLFRVPVQGSLMDKLLMRCDTGSGLFSWPEIISYLETAQPGHSPKSKTSPAVDQDRATSWPNHRTQQIQQPPDRVLSVIGDKPLWEQKKPLGRLGTRKLQKTVYEVEEDIIRYDTPATARDVSRRHLSLTSQDLSEEAQLGELAREHRQRREEQERETSQKQQSALHPDDDPWFVRFMHLARGVYNSDSSNSGFLDIDEMFRLIKNYNLIYQLGLSTAHIQSVVTAYAKGSQQVPIEPILAELRLEKPE